MEQLKKDVKAHREQAEAIAAQLGIDKLTQQAAELEANMQRPDFWSDSTAAQVVSKQHAGLKTRIEPWQSLLSDSRELEAITELNDPELAIEAEQQLSQLKDRLDALKSELRFNGPYDDHNAILSIHAGAGGTDAQDWAQMLLRMYTRWAEAHDMNMSVIEQSAGDEAGLKSVTIELSGLYVYGKLKGEHGVHRLVRLSPYNADNLRQTSFAKVEVLPKIEQPEEVVVDEGDLKIDVFRSGGHGGQSVNTTDSAVRITHLPTGIVVVIQNERSQLQNRESAMTILRSRLAQLKLEQHKQELGDIKGPNQSAEWGNQIRSYVLHPYKQVKDLRTRFEISDAEGVLDGNLDPLINAYLEHTIGKSS